MERLRVGVVGAGAAGLCAGRNLSALPGRYDFVIFEQISEVGGTWFYTDQVGTDQDNLPIHSSMYKNLRTNVPKEIMSFPDFPFPDSGKSFTHHSQVLLYLKKYASQFGLYDHIKFRRHVTQVYPEHSPGSPDSRIVWKMMVTDLDAKQYEEYEFDAVMICNGHYAVPNIPTIQGIEDFAGSTIHSHSYRKPEGFKDQTVVVLGAASSGIDIAVEISQDANQVYLSHNLPDRLGCRLPSNVTQRPGIKQADRRGFTFLDDSYVTADVLIFCTGYCFNFPFLDERCKVTIEGNRVMPLYKHLIHMDYISLCFVGLPFTVLPFPMFHFQVQYFLKTLSNQIKLPSRGQMEEETDSDYRKRIVDMQMPPKHAHKMGPLQWDYYQELGDEAQIQTLPPVCKMIYDKVEKERKDNVMLYKKEEYKVISGDEYVRSMPEP